MPNWLEIFVLCIIFLSVLLLIFCEGFFLSLFVQRNMASSFDRWEKDPFFSAAEEVQESADRYILLPRYFSYVLKMFTDDLYL